jgi:outer membrane lipoprotein-sorting protein
MISGARSLLAAGLLGFVASSAGQTWDLARLLEEMAQVPSSRSRFVETRHLAMLTRPVELKGSLSYERPHRLAKHVEAPFDETLTVDGEALSLVNRTSGEQRFLSLREQPALRALVESVRATLAGDRTQLERHYRVQFSGARDAWQMRLVPRDAQLRGYIASITLSGAGARLQRIESLESGGDSSVMTILHDAR